MKNAIIIESLFLVLLLTMIPAKIFAETSGRQMTASWYSIASLIEEGTYAYSNGVMANGKKFSDTGFTCATRLYPLGTKLRITRISKNKMRRSVIVEVTDRIGKRFKYTRIDLSQSAFAALCPLDKGLCKVIVKKVK